MKKITLLFIMFITSLGFSQTFTGATGAIPDNSCTVAHEFPVTVTGVGILGTTNIFDQVALDITHTWDSDLDISLIAPDGITIIDLSSDNGGSGDNYTATIFREDAVTPITSGSAPFTGTYLPEGDLSTLNGVDADGTWVLRVCDDAGGDTGTLNSWSITFAVVPTCLAPTTLSASNITATSADLSWVDGSGGSVFDYQYVVQAAGLGMPAGAGTDIDISSFPLPVTAGSLSSNTDYEVWVRANCGIDGFSTWVGPINFTTSTLVTCGTPVNTVFCYDDNDTTTFTYTSSDGSPLRITFNAGEIEDCCDDILIYDGTNNLGTLLYQGNNGGDLTGLTFDSTSDSIYIEIDSDGSVSCGDGSFTTSWDFDVVCATCVNPTATYTVVPDCGNGQYSIDVDVTSLGTATSLTITDGVTPLTMISTLGIQTFGPYADGASTTITLTNEQDAGCSISSGAITYVCPPSNDDCVNAIQVNCGDVVTGDTSIGATDSGSNASADVWYFYNGAAGDITVSLCTNTTFDSYLRIFDSCGGAQLAFNDDGCGAQSTVTFTADGTSTYYIMVEGFGTAEGAFELTTACVLSNDSFDSSAFLAYPNPVKDVLNLEYNSEISSVRVMNLLGQEVLSRNINANSTQVDMSQLTSGAYIVNVTVGDAVKTIKVVKQ